MNVNKLVRLSLFLGMSCIACRSEPNSLSGTSDHDARPGSTNELVLMSYNILHGAGVDPQYDEISAAHGFPGNRLAKILEVVRAVDPDILGIQEALSWESGTPSVAEQFADSLGGRNYFLALSKGIHHVAIYTKLKIVQAGNFRDQFSRAALRAALAMPQGDTLEVFVAHINPTLPDKMLESDFLARTAVESSRRKAILMGDLNQHAEDGPVAELLRPHGWQIAAIDQPIGIDHIWISSALSEAVSELDARDDFGMPRSLLNTASDHWPALARVRIR